MTTVIDHPLDDDDGVSPAEDLSDTISPEHERPRRSLGERVVEVWPELVLAAGSVVLFAWGLGRQGWANTYYSAAARSMTRSWSNFFYASLDPGGWVTVDKPPVALWTQALSARIFGFHPWALLLPSVLCGAWSVLLLASTIRRVWGRPAGLVAGAALAFTPMVLAVSRSNNPDITLVLCLVLAAWATQRGIEDARMRWILLAGVACGIGFMTKLLAAGLVMPGLWAAYLLCSPGRFRDRLLRCVAGAVAFFAVAVAWVAAVDLRPLADRPWIGGSSDGTARDLVFGYNGFGRVVGASDSSGGFQVGGGGGFGRPGGVAGIDQFGGATGIGRLFNVGMGDQVMWLVPISIVAAISGVVGAIRRRRRDARLGSVVMWTGWALVVYFLFAFAEGTFHNYYVSLLAPALAALVGIGAAQTLDLLRSSTGASMARLAGLAVVVIALVGTAVLQVILLRRVEAWTWLRLAVPLGVAAAVVAVVATAAVGPELRRWTVGALVSGALMLGVAPVVWTVAGLTHIPSGTFPDARPGAALDDPFSAFPQGGGPGGGRGGGASAISPAEWAWLDAQRSGERWELAGSSSMDSSASIIEGHDVVALGGFSGMDGSGSTSRVAQLVDTGQLRFFSLGGGFGGPGGSSSAITSVCTAVDASAWGGSGASGIYDCQGKADALRSAADAAPAGRGDGPIGLPGGGQVPAGAPGGGLQGADLQDLLACFEAQGFRASTGGNLDPGDPAFQQAMAACSAYLPPGGPGGGSPGAPP